MSNQYCTNLSGNEPLKDIKEILDIINQTHSDLKTNGQISIVVTKAETRIANVDQVIANAKAAMADGQTGMNQNIGAIKLQCWYPDIPQGNNNADEFKNMYKAYLKAVENETESSFDARAFSQRELNAEQIVTVRNLLKATAANDKKITTNQMTIDQAQGYVVLVYKNNGQREWIEGNSVPILSGNKDLLGVGYVSKYVYDKGAQTPVSSLIDQAKSLGLDLLLESLGKEPGYLAGVLSELASINSVISSGLSAADTSEVKRRAENVSKELAGLYQECNTNGIMDQASIDFLKIADAAGELVGIFAATNAFAGMAISGAKDILLGGIENLWSYQVAEFGLLQ